MAAHSEETAKSPMWWAMKLARGLKIVRSRPRSRISRSWLRLDRLAQFVVADLQLGGPRLRRGSRMPAIWRLRQSSSAFGAVV